MIKVTIYRLYMLTIAKNRSLSLSLSLSPPLLYSRDEEHHERRKRKEIEIVAGYRGKGLGSPRRNDRGQFVDVIDENASHSEAGESVEWSSGRPVVIFNFSIKAQVGRLMVATCSSGYFDSGSHSWRGNASALPNNQHEKPVRKSSLMCRRWKLFYSNWWISGGCYERWYIRCLFCGTNAEIGR